MINANTVVFVLNNFNPWLTEYAYTEPKNTEDPLDLTFVPLTSYDFDFYIL